MDPEMRVERRVSNIDTRPLPHAERRHGAPDTRKAYLNLYRVSYYYRRVPPDYKVLNSDLRPSPELKIANVVAESDVAAGNHISGIQGNDVVTVTLTTHDVTVSTGAPASAAKPAPNTGDLASKGFTPAQLAGVKGR